MLWDSERSLIFCDQQAKNKILRQMSDQSLFFDIKFIDPLHLYGSLSHRYFFFLKEQFSYAYDHAKQLIPYFDYIDIEANYHSEALKTMQQIKIRLLATEIYQSRPSEVFHNRVIGRVHHMPIPSLFGKNEMEISLWEKSTSPIRLVHTENDHQAAYAVYEEVVALLEKNVPIDRIKILNAKPTDEYTLTKLFQDSSIPTSSTRKERLSSIPEVIDLIRALQNNGYSAFLEKLETCSRDTKEAVIRLLNLYLEEDIRNHPNILVRLLEEASLSITHYRGCVTFQSLNEVDVPKENYYLVLHYTLDDFVDTLLEHPYLSASEIEEIGYPSLDEINEYQEQKRKDFLAETEHITLFFSAYSDHENIPSDIVVDRLIIEENYRYQIKEKTYLKHLSALEFAKAKYDLDTYYLERLDYPLLAQTFAKDYRLYNHAFTGIYQEDLKDLLQKNNTLTGAKIESYHLCQFQFLLKYLLKLGNVAPSPSQFLGTLTHSVLEQSIHNNSFDLEDVVMTSFDFPEEEKYKETIYRKALLQELQKILPIFIDFHQKTKFNEIETEINFKLPYQDFYITGIIDKAMVFQTSEENQYFVLVDYKIGEKDFYLEEFQEGRTLQLPLYLYAFMTMNPHAKPAGLYYQTTGVGRYKKMENAIETSFQLKGISLESAAVLQALDEDLTHLRSAKLKKDETFTKYSKVLNQADFIAMKYSMEKQIDAMIQNLKAGRFEINPLPSYGKKKDSISCEYCDFRALCYNKNKNLGGEEE